MARNRFVSAWPQRPGVWTWKTRLFNCLGAGAQTASCSINAQLLRSWHNTRTSYGEKEGKWFVWGFLNTPKACSFDGSGLNSGVLQRQADIAPHAPARSTRGVPRRQAAYGTDRTHTWSTAAAGCLQHRTRPHNPSSGIEIYCYRSWPIWLTVVVFYHGRSTCVQI